MRLLLTQNFISELYTCMGPISSTHPTHQMTDSTQLNHTIVKIWTLQGPTQPTTHPQFSLIILNFWASISLQAYDATQATKNEKSRPNPAQPVITLYLFIPRRPFLPQDAVKALCYGNSVWPSVCPQSHTNWRIKLYCTLSVEPDHSFRPNFLWNF